MSDRQVRVLDLFHRLGLVRKLEQVEIGVGDHDVLGLTADPSAHVHITVGAAGARRVDVQTNARGAFLAVPAPSASDVERNGNEVSHLDELHIAPGFDHLAGDLMAQDEPWGGRGTASHHVLIAAADIRGHDLQDHAVIASPPARSDQLRKVDASNLDLSGSDVGDATIACHELLLVHIQPKAAAPASATA